MSAPDGQVARLRICHAPKFVDPGVEVGRASVRIRESGARIKSVDKVGAIGTGRMMAGIQCGAQNREALVQSQRLGPVLLVGFFATSLISPVRPSLLLFPPS